MAITFKSAPSYFWLNAWVLANIIELATQRFCDRNIDYKIDPGRRLYDQMTQAARSIRANIAEGSGRHETSLETEMRLTDAPTHNPKRQQAGTAILGLLRLPELQWDEKLKCPQSPIRLWGGVMQFLAEYNCPRYFNVWFT